MSICIGREGDGNPGFAGSCSPAYYSSLYFYGRALTLDEISSIYTHEKYK